MKLQRGMWLKRTLKDPSGTLTKGLKYKVSVVNGISVQVVGGGSCWYSTNSFEIVFEIGDVVRFKNTYAGRTYVVRGTDSYTERVKLEGYDKWHDTSRLVMVEWRNTTKEGSMGTWNTDGLCDGCRNCCGDVHYDDACDECQEHRDDNCGNKCGNKPTPYGKIQPVSTGGNTMGLNTTIAALFDKTADAVLVQKYFGHQIAQNDVEIVKLSDKADELLKKAQDLQDKEDERRHTVTARVVSE